MYPYNIFSNLPNLLSSFNSFLADFQGNPEQKVQKLLNSGQMTPQQFETLQVWATQFMRLLK